MITKRNAYKLSMNEITARFASCPSCRLNMNFYEDAFICHCGTSISFKKIENIPAEWIQEDQKKKSTTKNIEKLKDVVDELSDNGKQEMAQVLGRMMVDYEKAFSIVLPFNKMEALRILQKVENSASKSNNESIRVIGSHVALIRHQLLKEWDK